MFEPNDAVRSPIFRACVFDPGWSSEPSDVVLRRPGLDPNSPRFFRREGQDRIPWRRKAVPGRPTSAFGGVLLIGLKLKAIFPSTSRAMFRTDLSSRVLSRISTLGFCSMGQRTKCLRGARLAAQHQAVSCRRGFLRREVLTIPKNGAGYDGCRGEGPHGEAISLG